MKTLYCFLIFIFFSCINKTSKQDFQNIEMVKVVNSGYKWNCGLSTWNPKEKEDLEFIRKMLKLLSPTEPVSVRINHWRVDLYLNNEKENLFKDNLMLYHTMENKLIFKKNEKFFSNDSLANYLVHKLQIKNSTSDPCLQ